MYSREETKTLSDKVLSMAADAGFDQRDHYRFLGNLDAIGDQSSWKMFVTGGDAKGQPTQTNSISHGSPYIRVKKIMVGAAYAWRVVIRVSRVRTR